MDYFLLLKSLHIIFVVTWFAGLFYIVRLFIYHREAQEKSEPDKSILSHQYLIMQKRLWLGITWPSAILTLIFGPSLLSYYDFPYPTWLNYKLLFLLGLFSYHLYCHFLYKQHRSHSFPHSASFLRIFNEIATLFLVSIVFLVKMQSALNMFYALLGLFLLMIILGISIRIYRNIRQN